MQYFELHYNNEQFIAIAMADSIIIYTAGIRVVLDLGLMIRAVDAAEALTSGIVGSIPQRSTMTGVLNKRVTIATTITEATVMQIQSTAEKFHDQRRSVGCSFKRLSSMRASFCMGSTLKTHFREFKYRICLPKSSRFFWFCTKFAASFKRDNCGDLGRSFLPVVKAGSTASLNPKNNRGFRLREGWQPSLRDFRDFLMFGFCSLVKRSKKRILIKRIYIRTGGNETTDNLQIAFYSGVVESSLF